MSSSFLEIVELSDGRIVLRRSEEEQPLVTLTFSPEVKSFLQERYIDVAKAMFHTGLQKAGGLEENEVWLDDEDEDASSTIHWLSVINFSCCLLGIA